MKSHTVVLYLGGGERAVFQPVLGRPLGAFALDASCRLDPDAVLVIAGAGRDGREEWEALIKSVATKTPVFLLAGGAKARTRREEVLAALVKAKAGLEKYPPCDILVVPAAMPLVGAAALRGLLRVHRTRGLSLTFLSAADGAGLTGVLALRSADVFPHLAGLSRERRADGFEALARRLAEAGKSVGFYACPAAEDAFVADKASAIGRVSRLLQERKNDGLARRGVVLLDPASTWIDWAVGIGPRTVIYPCVVIEGATRVGADVRIFPHVHITNSVLGRRVKILASTVMEDAAIEAGAQVGPFARLRPKTRVCAGAKVGNFVEMKNTVFGPRSKAQHLSYVGDSTVEEDVNVGAGTITCNYDGVAKNSTHIGAGAFIGSGTELVAPVRVGRGAYVAAGSTITRDVAAGALAIARARQVEKPGWVLDRVRARKRRTGGGEP